METKRDDIIYCMAESLRLLRLIDKRKIRYKNTWRHTLGELESFLKDQKGFGDKERVKSK